MCIDNFAAEKAICWIDSGYGMLGTSYWVLEYGYWVLAWDHVAGQRMNDEPKDERRR